MSFGPPDSEGAGETPRGSRGEGVAGGLLHAVENT